MNLTHTPAATGPTPAVPIGIRQSEYGNSPKHAAIVEQTEKWVAQTFYGTLLKQVRDSPFKDELFSGGRGGEAFGAMYDQQMAEHMTRGVGKKLVMAIVRKIEAANAYARQKRAAEVHPSTEPQQVGAAGAVAPAGPRVVQAAQSSPAVGPEDVSRNGGTRVATAA